MSLVGFQCVFLDQIDIRGFHKLSTPQECQYCQFYFSCAIRKELDQWSLQPWNVLLLDSLISNSHSLTSYVANKEGNCKYIGIQSWQECQYCQFCGFVKNPNHNFMKFRTNVFYLPKRDTRSSHRTTIFLQKLFRKRFVATVFISTKGFHRYKEIQSV